MDFADCCEQGHKGKYSDGYHRFELDQFDGCLSKAGLDPCVYQIGTPARVTAFLAQVGHQSAQLTSVVENLNHRADTLLPVWPNWFSLVQAADSACKPERIANIAYASVMGNGAQPVVTGGSTGAGD